MNQTVQTFLDTLKEREHILQLINQNHFLLKFVCGVERFYLLFKNEEVTLHSCEEDLDIYIISGDIASVKEILEGKERLRYLVQKELITVKAPFRIILLLESIFFLAKPNGILKQII
jgi:hypothetical protein